MYKINWKEKTNKQLLEIAGKNRGYYPKSDLEKVNLEIKRRKRIGQMRATAGRSRVTPISRKFF